MALARPPYHRVVEGLDLLSRSDGELLMLARTALDRRR
jgi:hypothetical protein